MTNGGSEEVKEIDWLERVTNSSNGNPRYCIHFTDGTSARTQPDATVAFELPGATAGIPVKVKLTRGGDVWDVEPLHSDDPCS